MICPSVFSSGNACFNAVHDQFRHDQSDTLGLTRRGAACLRRPRAVKQVLSCRSSKPRGLSHSFARYGTTSTDWPSPTACNCRCTATTDRTLEWASRRWSRVSSNSTVRAFIRMMLATICRLLATRCCISSSSMSFSSSNASFSRSDGTPRGDVFHAEQNGGAGTTLVKHLAGIQAHRAVAERGKFMLDLIVLHRAVFRDDFVQEYAQFRNVPLPISQRVEKSSLGVSREQH